MLPDYEITKSTNKKQKIIVFIEFALILLLIQSVIMLFTHNEEQEDAVRFRILANSNTVEDQQLKESIRQEIEPLINKALSESTSKKELVDNLKGLESSIQEIATTKANGMPISFERKEALFPTKRSGVMLYPQATYDAYILTIGSGKGDNWWCSLFPKICFPEEEEEKEEDKVTFFLWEWIKEIFA